MTAPSPVTLLQIGAFPPEVQAQIDAEFRCVAVADLEQDPALAREVRGIVTRSNQDVPAALVERLPGLEIIATNGVGYDLIPLGLAAVQHVGIVGLGRIGKDIARRLEPFGVVLAYHGRSDQHLAWRYEPDLATLARDVDVLIVVAPGGAETAHLIDAHVLAALGPEGYLVNVARGSLLDQAALLAALEQGTLAGAALDVFDQEPDIDPRFFTLDNVMLTPHLGSATRETRAAMAQLMLDNLRSWFRSGRALTPVVAA